VSSYIEVLRALARTGPGILIRIRELMFNKIMASHDRKIDMLALSRSSSLQSQNFKQNNQ
jgi:hypothetical protein